MKSTFVAGLIAAGLLVGGPAMASEQLAKDGGCIKCHHLEKDRKGPSVKTIAAKFKGKAGAVDQLAADLKAEKNDHPAPKVGDEDLKKILTWFLAQ